MGSEYRRGGASLHSQGRRRKDRQVRLNSSQHSFACWICWSHICWRLPVRHFYLVVIGLVASPCEALGVVEQVDAWPWGRTPDSSEENGNREADVQWCRQDLETAVKQRQPNDLKELLEADRGCANCQVRFHPASARAAFQEVSGSPVHLAANLGFDDILELLLEYGFSPSSRTSQKDYTVLQLAVMGSHIEVVRTLLKNPEVDVNAKDKDNWNALLWAVWENDVKVVALLLELKNIDVNEQDTDGYNALMWTAYEGRIEVMKVLLGDRRIDINAFSTDRRTALMMAANTQKAEGVEALLKFPGIDPNFKGKDQKTALMIAAYKRAKEVMEALLRFSETDPNIQDGKNRTALMMVADSPHVKLVRAMLQNPRVDVNLHDQDGYTALMFAAFKGQEEVLKVLLSHTGIEVNAQDKDGRTAMMWAAMDNHFEAVVDLTETVGIEVDIRDENGESALMLAAGLGRSKTVEFLLGTPGVDINAVNKDHQTALMKAAAEGHKQAVILLLNDKNVEANMGDKDGRTALILASARGQAEVAPVLCKDLNTDVNAKDKDGETALIAAARQGHFQVVEYLTRQQRVNPLLTNKDGRNAMMVGAANGHVQVCETMFMDSWSWNEAISRTFDKDGNTALALAAKNGHVDVVNYLLVNTRNRDHKNKVGESAFFLAARSGEVRVVRVFLERIGALSAIDPVAESNKAGDDVLMAAVSHGKIEVAEFFINRGGWDLKRRNKAGWNYLHHAVNSSSHTLEMVKLVLQHWPDLKNEVNKEHRTALQIAVEKGDIQVVQALLHMKAEVRHPTQGRGSALRTSLEIGNYILTKVLLDNKASVEKDIEPDDREGKRLAVWMGVEFSLEDLVQPFADKDGETWKELWEPPSTCRGDIEGTCRGLLLSRATTASMVHLLLSWQRSEEHSDQIAHEQASAALKHALQYGKNAAAVALLARGVRDEQETDPTLAADEFAQRVQVWNLLHWSAYSCDTVALSLAFVGTTRSLLQFLDDDRGGQTPMQVAEGNKHKCPGTYGVLHQLKVLQGTLDVQASTEVLAMISTAVSVTGSLKLNLAFLRFHTLQKRGCCFLAFPLGFYSTACFIVAWVQWSSPNDIGRETAQIAFAIVSLIAGIAGVALFCTMGFAFHREKFARQLQGLKKKGNDRLERCWEKLDCGLGWFLVTVIFIKGLMSGVQKTTLAAGICHAVASTLLLCAACPKAVIISLRITPGAFVLFETVRLTLGHSARQPSLLWAIAGAIEEIPPTAQLLATLCIALSWLEMPGLPKRIAACAVHPVEIEMVGATTGKYAATQLILGRAAMAAHGIEYTLGLTPEKIAAGLKDPIEAMRQEIQASGDENDRENFRYIVEGCSGEPSDYPSAVAESLNTGLYHGGTLGPNDFDTGHAGRTLQEWMQVPEVVLSRLSEAEFIAVRFYTSSSYARINGPLRKEIRPHPWAMTVYLLDRGIKKLRSVQAQVNPKAFAGQTTLWRGMKNLEVDVKEFSALGGTEMAPMSTTTCEDVARHYASSEVPLLFKYPVGGLKTGVSIQFLSLYPREEEVLYAPLTFLSLKNHYMDDGTQIFVVEPVMS